MPTDRHDLLDNGTAGPDISPLPRVTETKPAAARLTEDAGILRRTVEILNADAGELHQHSLIAEWIERTTKRGRASIQDLLDDLADLGFAWRDIARMVGVSVPAVQKWRRGEGASGENRLKVAGLLAACDLVTESYPIAEVASWFEMPIHPDAPLTPIDLWSDGRRELLFEHASGHTPSDQILSALDPQWRERYHSDFEIFVAGDGQRSIRPKGR